MSAFEFPDPAFGDRVDRDGIDEMQLLSALPFPGNEVCLLEDRQMFRNGLACHVQPLAKLTERLTIPSVQPVEELPAV